MTFVPTPFATPVIAPRTVSMFRAAPYISVSQYRFTPTSVATQALVQKSQQPQVDSAAALAEQIAEASSMMDDHCFHRHDGSFSAMITTEEMWAKPKSTTGELVLICNFKPILEVVGLGIGPVPSQLQDINPMVAADIVVGEKTIILPGWWTAGVTTSGTTPVLFGGYPTTNGKVLAVYSYIAGFPHSTLAANASAGDTSITVEPSTPGGTVFYGAYQGSALSIKDGANTETVVLASAPTGTTLSLSSSLQYAHSVPQAPDSVVVTALPGSLERACVYLVNFLIKSQGMRAQVPAHIGAGTPAQRQAMGRAGTLTDWDTACHMLRPYVVSYLHGPNG